MTYSTSFSGDGTSVRATFDNLAENVKGNYGEGPAREKLLDDLGEIKELVAKRAEAYGSVSGSVYGSAAVAPDGSVHVQHSVAFNATVAKVAAAEASP